VGAFAVQDGFTYAVGDAQGNVMHRAAAALKLDGSIQRAMQVQQRP
jgi:hypothetical protein